MPSTITPLLALDEELSLTLRVAVPADHDLIRSSWVNHLENSPAGRVMPKQIYRREQRWLVGMLLEHHGALVAVDREHPEHVLGWICGDPTSDALHYAFVKSEFRGRGIARFLFRALLGTPAVVFYTQWREAIPRKHPTWIYNPYLLARIR